MNKKQAREVIERNARANLLAWLKKADEVGTIYYLIKSVSKSGMSRVIEIACVSGGELDYAWPDAYGVEPNDPETSEAFTTLGGSREALDVAAKHIGFNYKDRAFRINGVGMDMVFALIGDLSYIAQKDLPESERVDYDNKIRRVSMKHD